MNKRRGLLTLFLSGAIRSNIGAAGEAGNLVPEGKHQEYYARDNV
jgi:hypothetical protein